MNGVTIDLSYLTDSVRLWKLAQDPLTDPQRIALKYGRQLAKTMQPLHLNRLTLLVKSAIPWIHLKNFHPDLDIDGDTPTDIIPQSGDRRWWYAAYSTLALVGALKLRVVSYTCESNGWVFAHLTPKPGEGSLAENSLNLMAGHTDALHCPFPSEFDESRDLPPPAPDFVVLIGIRNPDKVNTLVARLSKLLENISSRAQDQLRQPIFLFNKQDTFDTSFGKLIGYPVLHRHSTYGDFIRFSSSRVAVDAQRFPEGDQALTELREALPKCRETICVTPGDVLLINNRTALHGRDAILKHEYAGKTRWLVRTYGYRTDTPGRFKDKKRPHLLFCERA